MTAFILWHIVMQERYTHIICWTSAHLTITLMDCTKIAMKHLLTRNIISYGGYNLIVLTER